VKNTIVVERDIEIERHTTCLHPRSRQIQGDGRGHDACTPQAMGCGQEGVDGQCAGHRRSLVNQEDDKRSVEQLSQPEEDASQPEASRNETPGDDMTVPVKNSANQEQGNEKTQAQVEWFPKRITQRSRHL
jgi:hypothetical protein